MELLRMRRHPAGPEPGVWQTADGVFDLMHVTGPGWSRWYVWPSAGQHPWAFHLLADHGLTVPVPGLPTRIQVQVFFPTRRAALAALSAAYEEEGRRGRRRGSALSEMVGGNGDS